MRNSLLRPRFIAVCRLLKSPIAHGRIGPDTVHDRIKNGLSFFSNFETLELHEAMIFSIMEVA